VTVTATGNGTNVGTVPPLDQLLADWGSVSIEASGRTVLLPAHNNADSVVFTVVLPLHQTTPEAVAPALLWAASLPLCRVGSITLQERIEELGGESTLRVVAGAVLLAGSCPHRSLTMSLDAIRCAMDGPGVAPQRLRAKARELAEQHLLRWDNVEMRAQALARRMAFGPRAPLPAPTLHQELTDLCPSDIEHYRSCGTDPGWLVVAATDPPRWPEHPCQPPVEPPAFRPHSPPEPRIPIFAEDPGRGIGAVAFAGVLCPGLAGYWETRLASTVLGGYFASRLWEQLRAGHGRVYSPRSILEHTAAGPNVLITANTASDDFPDTVRTVRQELARLCQHGVDGPELLNAQRYLLGGLLRSANGARRLCALVATWLARGVPPARLLASASMIRDVTPGGVLRAARLTFAPSVMSVVLCGARPTTYPSS
jgi:hypothetical protein